MVPRICTLFSLLRSPCSNPLTTLSPKGLQRPCDVHVLSPLCLGSSQISCYICPIPMDKGGLNPVLAHVCLLVTGISWFHLQSLVSSLFLSVFRRAPPGKCKYKPVPVKTKSKRVQFRPLASESISVFRLRPWHRGAGRVPSANSCNPGVAGLIFSPKAYPLAEGYDLWLSHYVSSVYQGERGQHLLLLWPAAIHSFIRSFKYSFIHLVLTLWRSLCQSLGIQQWTWPVGV